MALSVLRSTSGSRIIRLSICILLYVSSAAAQDTRVTQAEHLFAQRPDLSRVRQAISLLVQMMKAEPESYEAHWRLAKYYHFLGQHAASKQAATAAFEKGIGAGRRAVALQPNRPEAHFWLAVNYGDYGQRRNIFKRWRLVKPMGKELEAVIRIDPHYENGSAYAVLGRLYSKLPGLFGGDLSRGIGYLEKAVEMGPDNSLAKLFLAESYLKAGRKPEAKRWLRSILTQAPDKDYEFEFTEHQQRAHQLLRKHFR